MSFFGFGRSPVDPYEDETVFSDDPTYYHDDDDDDLYTDASSHTLESMETRLFDEDEDCDDSNSEDEDDDDDDETYLDDDDEGTYADGITTKTSYSHSQFDSYDDDSSSDEDYDDDDDTFDDRTLDTYDHTVGRLSDEEETSVFTADTRTTAGTRGVGGGNGGRSPKKSRANSPAYSHSFASDATEERAHVSSPRTNQQQRSSSASKSFHFGGTGGGRTSPTERMMNGRMMRPPSKQQAMSPSAKSMQSNVSGSVATNTTHRINNHRSNTSKTTTNPGSPLASKYYQKQLVAGGGPAKKIGMAIPDEREEDDNGDEELDRIMAEEDDVIFKPDEELMKYREMAKAEFSVGSAYNRRYHPSTPTSHDETTAAAGSEVSLSILDRDEVFHASAAAAVASLLTPTRGSFQRGGDNLLSPTSKNGSNARADMVGLSGTADSGTGGGDRNTAADNESLVQQLLTKRTEKRLEQIKSQMKDPTKRLTDLMSAIASPDDKTALDRHYMVRRKNACGALQVLTVNPKHRVNICWTVGVLPALTSVLEDCGKGTLDDAFPDRDIQNDYVEARNRAVSALVNLSSEDNNKLPMFHCPRLVASIIRVINQDDTDSRRGCCIVLANLGKSKENKLLMAQVPGLLDCITNVVRPKEYFHQAMSEDDDDNDMSVEDGGVPDVFDRIVSSDDADSTTEKGTHQKGVSKCRSDDPAETSARYDEDPNDFTNETRQYAFALLIHLVKQKDNAFVLARHGFLVDTLLQIAKLQESLSQHYGLQILAHLTRHRGNSKLFVFKNKTVVPTMVFALGSENTESRKYACFCLQNLSQDKPCRQELALVEGLIPSICRRIRTSKNAEEKLAALHTLKNLTDEPANLIPMTNTPECFATLMQVAHASDDSVTEMMQYLGCDALATLSHWLRSIATSGQRIGTIRKNNENLKDNLFVPSLKVVRWEPWQ